MGKDGANGRFAANFSWMMVQQVYNMLISLIVGSLSARYLGPANYGLLNYSASVLSFFAIISRLGLESVVVNEMLHTPRKRGSYLGTALVMRLAASVIALFSIVAVIRVMEPDNQALHVIALLQSFSVVLQGYEVFGYWFQMELKMKYVSVATMAALTVAGVWRVALLATEASVYFFALTGSVQALVCGGLVAFLFFKKKDKALRLSFCVEDGKELLKKSRHLLVASLAVTLYMEIDKVMIGKFLNAEAVGIYAAATTVSLLWECVPNALIRSARPLIIQQRTVDRNMYIRRLQQLLLTVTLLSVAVSLGITLLGRFVILILYGDRYLEAVLPLSILIWSTGFAMVGTARSIWIVAEGYNRYVKYYVFIGAAANLVMNLAAIRLWGITGAAVTTLISQFLVALVAPLLFKQTRSFVVLYFQSFKLLPELAKTVVSAMKKRG